MVKLPSASVHKLSRPSKFSILLILLLAKLTFFRFTK